MSIKSLNDDELITAYEEAKKLYLDPRFIRMLLKEICDRKIDHLLKQKKEDYKKSENDGD